MLHQSELSANSVVVKNYSFKYRGDIKSQIKIDHLKLKYGERLLLHGPSGAGKSTLLKLLSGIIVGHGCLQICDTDILKLSPQKMNKFRAENIGIVHQQLNLIPYLSAFDNIELSLRLSGRWSSNSRGEIASNLGDVGLDRKVCVQAASTLSIGQQQRVAIVRALIHRPRLLLLDEASSALDDSNLFSFMNFLNQQLQEIPSTTIVFVSHDPRVNDESYRKISIDQIIEIQ